MSVEPEGAAVKPARHYDISTRRAGAARRRDAVLDAALGRFLAEGYGSTTVASIAADARVSVDTIYKVFGGKPGLVRAIHARALEGTGVVPAETRSDALRSTHAWEVVQGWGLLLAEVSALVTPILLLIRDAAAQGDPEMTRLNAEVDSDRLRRMTDNARYLHDGAHLRAGVTPVDAADLLWLWSAPEIYELLVVRRGWSARKYGQYAADNMAAALLPHGSDDVLALDGSRVAPR